jgi:hypothetical protein
VDLERSIKQKSDEVDRKINQGKVRVDERKETEPERGRREVYILGMRAT